MKKIIDDFLATIKPLIGLTTQGGWIVPNSIQYKIIKHDQNKIIINVDFHETNIDASGCVFDPIECNGYLALYFDSNNTLLKFEVLEYL